MAMTRKTTWILGLLAGAVALSIAWANRQLILSSPSTPEQRRYLPGMLAGSSSVTIRRHPKLGGDILCVITSRPDIAELVAATELARVEPPCACFGLIDLDFVRPDGTTVSLNYKSAMGDTYVKFNNDWNIQGIPSRQFERLVAKHLRTAGTTSPDGLPPRRP